MAIFTVRGSEYRIERYLCSQLGVEKLAARRDVSVRDDEDDDDDDVPVTKLCRGARSSAGLKVDL